MKNQRRNEKFMDIVFMGTPEFSTPILDALVAAGHNVKAVVTQGDKPRGRGMEVRYTPVKEAALKYGIDVYQPSSLKNDDVFFGDLSKINPDIIVVVAYGLILPKKILELPKYGCVNVHASLLPKLRGASPIQTAIINGDKTAGVTTMLMDEGTDTGDMLEKSEIPISADDTGGSLHDKLSELGAKLIITTLAGIEAGTLTPVKQEESQATFTRMLNKKMGKINFNMPAVEIERLVRGLYPWPGSYTAFKGKMLKIFKCDVGEAQNMQEYTPGTIVEAAKDYIAVQTGKNLLLIRELQLEGRGRMKAEEFLRGYKIEKRDRLGEQED